LNGEKKQENVNVSAAQIRHAILSTRGIKLKAGDVRLMGNRQVVISSLTSGHATQRMAFLADRVPSIVVQGLSGVKGLTFDKVFVFDL
jgi:hypothetical protein